MTQTETASDLAPNRAPDERIICALDVPTTAEAAALVERVQDAVGFARLLLAPDPARLARFDAALDSGETVRVATGRPIDVRLLYWTAFLDGQGRVAFRDDIYRRDTRLAEALGIALHLPRPDDRRADADDVGP